jgi:hypothetical protein
VPCKGARFYWKLLGGAGSSKSRQVLPNVFPPRPEPSATTRDQPPNILHDFQHPRHLNAYLRKAAQFAFFGARCTASCATKMFYSESLLSKTGPLARVWLSANLERKLSKTHILQSDIKSSVGAIVDQGQAPMALRLSGQLLLGVVRIYKRQAGYLLDDCNDALVKIKMVCFSPLALLFSC